jgi:hypothetical protein
LISTGETMANESPFTRESASRTDPVIGSTSTLLVGAGIDSSTAGTLTIGATNATSIVLSAPVTFDSVQAGTIQTRTVTIGHADLTDADGEQAINIGAVLPANSMIVGVNVALATPFSGGTATSVLLDIGTSGDPDAIVSNCDLFAAAVNGVASSMPAGIAPFKLFVSAGAQLLATVAADDDVADLVAGAATITVSFVALP